MNIFLFLKFYFINEKISNIFKQARDLSGPKPRSFFFIFRFTSFKLTKSNIFLAENHISDPDRLDLFISHNI